MTIQTKLFLLALFLISFGKNANSQSCPLPQAQKILNANNISTTILNGGDLLWDRTTGHFIANSDGPNPISTIFNAGLWMGGFTELPDNPNLKVAAAGYNGITRFDFSTGPLSEMGTTNLENCNNYDQLWEVFGGEIKQHIEDFSDDGIVTIQHQNIYGYPAHQNPFFEALNGFALPNTPQGLAPFWDNNNDGIYNPDDGDYPLPSAVHQDHYPAHLIWGIFNDAGSNHSFSDGESLRAEIQLTAWAFSCTDNETLNNTIFTSHKIINRSQFDLDSAFVGMSVDFTLGCMEDDYVGSIPNLNTFYAYNSDNLDGDINGNCTFGTPIDENLPVQAVTFLNQEMSSFGITVPDTMPPTQGCCIIPAAYYNRLSGSWLDGTPFTYGGDGYNSGGAFTSYLFDGNPNLSSEWSMTSAGMPNLDYSTFGNVSLGTFDQGQTFTMDIAYTFYQDENLDNLETVNLIYGNTPPLQQMYDSQFQSACNDLYLPNKNLELSNIQIFPNPTSDILNVKMENTSSARFSIFDIYGKKVLEKRELNQSEIQLSTSDFSQGVYFIKIEMEGKELVKKFIKM